MTLCLHGFAENPAPDEEASDKPGNTKDADGDDVAKQTSDEGYHGIILS